MHHRYLRIPQAYLCCGAVKQSQQKRARERVRQLLSNCFSFHIVFCWFASAAGKRWKLFNVRLSASVGDGNPTINYRQLIWKIMTFIWTYIVLTLYILGYVFLCWFKQYTYYVPLSDLMRPPAPESTWQLPVYLLTDWRTDGRSTQTGGRRRFQFYSSLGLSNQTLF